MSNYQSPHFTLEKLADGVYAAIAAPDGAAISNAGFVDLGNRTLVFDAMMGVAAGRDLMFAAGELTDSPVWLVANSHWHSDHTFGNCVYSPATQIITTSHTCELMAQRLPDQIKEHTTFSQQALEESHDELAGAKNDEERELFAGHVKAWELMNEDLDLLRLRLPDITFERQMTFFGSQRRAALATLGGGHTASDAVLYLPDDGILFAGDLLFNGRHPWMGDGNPAEWLKILDSLEALKPRVWVPGHGAVTDQTAVATLRNYIKMIQSLLADAHASGASIDAVATQPIPAPFDQLPNADAFERNLRSLYEQQGQ